MKLEHQTRRFFEPLLTDKDRCQNCGRRLSDHTNGTCPKEEPFHDGEDWHY